MFECEITVKEKKKGPFVLESCQVLCALTSARATSTAINGFIVLEVLRSLDQKAAKPCSSLSVSSAVATSMVGSGLDWDVWRHRFTFMGTWLSNSCPFCLALG